ncbi:MAG: hypothetical protein M0D57_01200 [Sphingobacteriales bacterium JAD_PAG50586_3]|nr:MAG: hypothetical protein M0D57_01200 [Sphingobacteriales bacterium JAD_PAG50586_3]
MTAKPYIFLLLFLALISCNKESDNKPTQIDTLDYRDSIVGTYSGSAIFEGMTGTFFYQRTLEVVIDSTNVDGIIIYNDNCYPNGDKYALDTNYTFSALVGSGEFRNDSMYFSCDNPQVLGTISSTYRLKKN